ncbi:HD-GYP domain-containing protein [Paenibacillus oenotherae]|uniref:HD-GYP domain-containing protein n=1 Tax=Paenibacillus oenotherae TaxID=1435645 RepID=A0ABS7D7V5_9BACL|nr:HD-GYP domain-containing protein [Paenibacillus oenotherae]MBW7476028.1 HD-GYP domain-containing protein [Paenibacillus oenotherae]
MRGRGRSIIGPLASMVLPIGVFEWLRTSQTADITVHSPTGHFYMVSAISGLALILAVAVGIAGQRLRNLKVGFLSLSYVSLAGIFVLHGLSTPGFLMEHTGIAGAAAQISIMLAVMWLFLSAVSPDNPIIRLLAQWRAWLIPCWLLLLVVVGVLSMSYPELMNVVPLLDEPYIWIASGLTAAACLWTMYRYWQSYQAARFPLQGAIVYSLGWLLASQYIMVAGTIWQLSWWLYHMLLLGSMIMMLGGLIQQYFSRGSFSSSLKVLFQSDPRAWLEACMTPSVRALIMATEVRDAYTAGHNMRVALYALRLAEEMGLTSDQLRAIAQGGVVHDVGKLKVPDSILNKPGKLTHEERFVIEMHPVSGYDMCKRLGFLHDELSVIRSHHEKWDGSGYPDRIAGEHIPLLARITAIADVYDALTSSRSYRKAMSHDEAMAIIEREQGSHFDPACVAAWIRLAQENPEFFHEMAASDRGLRLVHVQEAAQ